MHPNPTPYYICNPSDTLNAICSDILHPEDFSSSLKIQTPTRKYPQRTSTVSGWETNLDTLRMILKKSKDAGIKSEYKIAHRGTDGYLHWTPRNQYDPAGRRKSDDLARVRKQIQKIRPKVVRGKIGLINSPAD